MIASLSSFVRFASGLLCLLLASCSFAAGPMTYPTVFPHAQQGKVAQTCHARCFEAFSPSGNAQQDVATLTQRCGQDCGMTPIGAPVIANGAAGGQLARTAITLSSQHCYRIVAVGGSGIADLDSGLVDMHDRVLQQDTASDAFPLIGAYAPYCPAYSGAYEILMSVTSGQGEYAYQVLQDGAPEPAATAAPAVTESPMRECAATCYAGFVPSQQAQTDVQTLAQRCGTGCGMTAVAAQTQLGRQSATDQAEEYEVRLERGQCYRLFAAGGQGVSDMDAGIMDPSGNIVLKDTANDAWPVLGLYEPFCPMESATYGVEISVAAGDGEYAFQLWQSARQ